MRDCRAPRDGGGRLSRRAASDRPPHAALSGAAVAGSSPLKDAMHNRFRQFSVPCAIAIATVLSACSSTPKPLYQQEQFDAASSPYAHTFHSKSDATCEGARRALLSQGYITTSARPDAIDGTKNFQPDNDTHVVIEFHVVCADANGDGTSSIAYVSAVQDRYALKKTSTSASVGLSLFGSVSLPIGSSDDAMIKIASETIPAGVFYERFFNLVDHFLKVDPARRDRATVKAAEKERVAPLPEPAPTPQGEPMKLMTPAVPTPPAPPVAAGGVPAPAARAGAAAAQTPAAAPAAHAPASVPAVTPGVAALTVTPASMPEAPVTAPIAHVAAPIPASAFTATPGAATSSATPVSTSQPNAAAPATHAASPASVSGSAPTPLAEPAPAKTSVASAPVAPSGLAAPPAASAPTGASAAGTN
ncbi:conserved protein of unknown function [Burkholderia multivorans]